MLVSLYRWFVRSSADPAKLSLTIKGALGLLTGLALATGLTHAAVPSTDIDATADSVVALITAVISVVSAAMTAYGFVRKVILTITGQNAAIGSRP